MSEGPHTKVALVTGVSRQKGIGRALVDRLLRDGMRVLASGWHAHDAEMPWGRDSTGDDAVATLSDAREAGRLVWVERDLECPESPAELVGLAFDTYGALDVLVANHARSSHHGLGEVSAAELDRCWAVNVRASVLLIQALAARRAPGPGGRAILFTSGQHIGPMSGEIAYAVSKGAIHQMTMTLADAVIDSGITVNCINPGPVDSGWLEGPVHEQVAEMFPARRWGQPEDVARLVSWLASDESAWITGQVIDSEGGFRRWAALERDS